MNAAENCTRHVGDSLFPRLRCWFFLMLCLSAITGFAKSTPLRETLCKQPEFRCHTVARNEHWGTLFPDPVKRDLVRRINRMNGFLQPDMQIAIPVDIDTLDMLSASPLPRTLVGIHENTVIVHLGQQVFGAYDAQGKLVRWGPVSSGSILCPELHTGCSTPPGHYRVTRKSGAGCVSNTFPASLDGKPGGGEMPWCIFFNKGYALHGSAELPGYPASHGCVRLFPEDAAWLNQHFVGIPQPGKPGTAILVGNSLAELFS